MHKFFNFLHLVALQAWKQNRSPGWTTGESIKQWWHHRDALTTETTDA